jgi:AcrR family transcriptional regulator
VSPEHTARPSPVAASLTLPGPGGGARDQRKLDTLAALRRAAVDLALERGVERITVADIAAAAGVSRRTFFNYFATKEDALVGENPQMAEFLGQALAGRPAGEPPLTAVHRALQETFAVFLTDDIRDRIAARHRLLAACPGLLPRHLARYAAFEHLLAEAVTARSTGSDPAADPELLATVIAGAVRLCLQRWSRDGHPPLARQLDTAFAALRDGLEGPAS